MSSDLEKKVKDLESQVAFYEQDGAAKLFYAINRKMNEIASLLNAVNLRNIDITAKADASFERIFKLLEKAESLNSAVKALSTFSGVTNDEEKDTQNPKFRKVLTAENMADEIGEAAGVKKQFDV